MTAAPGSILTRDTEQYEACRTRSFNADDPGRFPAEIHLVHTNKDVIQALGRARQLKKSVGVRSGGHIPSKPSLLHDGVLIDTTHLNREVIYDSKTHEVNFGPAVRVFEAWQRLEQLGRFFPFGHAPTVALGGFCLAGGQGFFMRGWGATITEWIVKMEIVVPDGRVVIASRTENPDLFWAARGSGQAFFGVVTRIWSRTVPKRQLFGRSFVFTVQENFEELLSFAFERNRATPKMCTETALCTFYPEKFGPSTTELVPEASQLLLAVAVSAYADSVTEAKTMLSAWDNLPEQLKPYLVETKPVAEASWEAFFQDQEHWNPENSDQKWGINSILNDPSVPESKLIKAIKPALCNLPTLSSYGCLYMSDTVTPDEDDAVFSLPQQYYISTFSGWKDPSLRPLIQTTMRDSYRQAETVACGMYVADFDQSSQSLHSPEIKVWTDTARARFLAIRRKWDPDGLFPGYKAFTVGVKNDVSL
ncbi:hypothetical protein BGZ61DRAFT_530219 [Ilyonectria robusta]|uniref:uncharacterized protein n=1 Tax=Ilyonectria robusta TaxID=1079257 RepID=UPI001E8ECB8F|nr:uncharacterized protein BGZ61DRAFT_530219 [Ilyonectria robusta]KAH8721693.1 hypothetical protein BGZ61DRAFT_530219 [Ilyonectria robusta]